MTPGKAAGKEEPYRPTVVKDSEPAVLEYKPTGISTEAPNVEWKGDTGWTQPSAKPAVKQKPPAREVRTEPSKPEIEGKKPDESPAATGAKPLTAQEVKTMRTRLKSLLKGINAFASLDETLVKKICKWRGYTYHENIYKAVKMLYGAVVPFVQYGLSDDDDISLAQAFVSSFGGAASGYFSLAGAIITTYCVELTNKGISYAHDPDSFMEHLEDNAQDVAIAQGWNFLPGSYLYSPWLSGYVQQSYREEDPASKKNNQE